MRPDPRPAGARPRNDRRRLVIQVVVAVVLVLAMLGVVAAAGVALFATTDEDPSPGSTPSGAAQTVEQRPATGRSEW